MDRHPALFPRSTFLLGCMALLGGCKTAGFQKVWMSTDSGGRRRTKIFPPRFIQGGSEINSGIFCQIKYSCGRDDAELRIFITPPSEDTPIVPINGDFMFLNQGEGQILTVQFGILVEDTAETTKIDPLGPFEEGTYKLDFYIDKHKEDSTSFVVQELDSSDPP